MNKLPKVYENPINKKITNDQELFRSDSNTILKSNKDINMEIDKIFASNRHITKSRVRISLQGGNIITDIIGKTNNSVLTMDNRLIRISDILDIEQI